MNDQNNNSLATVSHNTDTQNTSSTSDILELFGIDESALETFTIHHKKDGIHINVKLKVKHHICPVCLKETSRIKGYTKKVITHSILHNNSCYIDYDARRYQCPHCHKTFLENNPFTFDRQKISVVTVYNVLTELKKSTSTFKSTADMFHISPTTVSSIFDNHVSISRRKLPRYLCLDEVYSFKSHNSKYVCVLLDFTTNKVIDLLPSRRKDELINYLSLIPREEREKVEIVSFDMWDTYRIVSKIMFPHCVCAIDHFHVIQELNNKVDDIRKKVMNKYYKEKNELKNKDNLSIIEKERLKEVSKYYYVLKKFNWMFLSKDNKIDPNAEKKYNHVLERYMNYYDIYDYMIHLDSDLDIALSLKDDVLEFYKKCTYDEALDKLNIIIKDMNNSTVSQMIDFSKTLTRWKREIVNSFIIVSKGNKNTRINNGIIENRNKAIKNIKHNSNGYQNWERFKNRVLYCLNDDTTYHMNPIQRRVD